MMPKYGKILFVAISLVFSAGPVAAQVNMVVADYVVDPGDCGGTIQLGTGSTRPFTLTIPPPNGFSVGCRVAVINADTGRGKFLSGALVSAYELPVLLFPRQSFTIQVDRSGWGVIRAPGRWLAPPGTTFYLDATYGSDTNDGLAPGAGNAWKTTLHAVRVLKQSIDFGLTWGAPVYVSLAASGTPYGASEASGIWVNGPFVGAATEDNGINAKSCPVVFKGDAENPANVVVSSIAGDAVTGIGAAFFCVQDMELVGASSDIAAGGASVIRFGNVVLGASRGAKIRSGHGSAIENYSGTTVHLNGNSSSVFWGLVDGNIYMTNATITIDSSFAVTQFALAESAGGLHYTGNTINGPGVVTGAKFQLSSGGYIYTGTNDLSLLPGTLPGRFAGGFYDNNALPAATSGK